MRKFSGKTAVVTGGASGIGLAIARRLAREGMRLVLADVEEQALQVAADELKSAGADAIGVPTDVTRFESVEALERQADYHCQYVSDWVAIKQRWALDLSVREVEAVVAIKASCQ